MTAEGAATTLAAVCSHQGNPWAAALVAIVGILVMGIVVVLILLGTGEGHDENPEV